MVPLRIHLFGGFLLERGHAALPPIASRSGRSLFAHLATNRDRPQQRDLLSGIFWPDLPEGRARRRLSHTLWQIQDVVNTPETSYLDVTTDTLAFDTTTPYWLDVEEFDRIFNMDPTAHPEASEVTLLREAVELYRGDFLAGYFDDWVIEVQDLYRQRYLKALRRLVNANKSTGAYEEALDFARRLTHHDLLDEEAHREVMRLNFLLGRTAEAIEQYERCRSVLEEELGTEPSAPTVELYDKVLRQRRSGIRPLHENDRSVLLGQASETPFVGREHERRMIVDALERVLGGTGGVVLVEGEPGVGKTRLTLEVMEDARWRGFEVSWGSCRPGAVRPFAPIIDILDSLSPLRVEQLAEQLEPVWIGEISRLAPALEGRSGPQGPATLRPVEESTRMIESLVHTLEAMGRIAPHLVIVDDVHWADRDTLSVLRQLGPRLAASRVLVLLLYRSEEARGDVDVWDAMRDLDRGAGLGRAVLSPLSVFELEEMVRRILGTTRLDSPVVAKLHRQTGGNVLFTLETLLAMRDRGLFDSDADPAAVLESHLEDDGIPVAPRVRSVIESRLSLLAPEVAAVYELAAVCGDRIDLALLEEVTDFDRTTVLRAMDELLYRGLILDDDSGRFRIAHDQVRQVAYESIDDQRRVDLHEVVASVLAGIDPEDVESIGHHYREAGDAERATSYLYRAGLRAIGLSAFATARHQLRAARETAARSGMPDVGRYQMLGHLEDALNVLGRRDEQHEVIAEMMQLASDLPALLGDAERRQSWLLAQEGALGDAEKSANRSIEMEEESGDPDALATSLVALGTIRRWSGRPLEAVPPLSRATSTARSDGERAQALTELASTLVEVQQIDEALAYLAEATEIFTGAGDLRGQAEVAGIEARALRIVGERDAAIARYRTAIEVCREIGYRHGEGVNLTNLSNLQQLAGDVAAALDGYDRAARIFEELGNKRGEAMVLANSASARHNLLGDDVRARNDASRAMQHFSEIGDRARSAQCQEVVAGVAARSGDLVEAQRLLSESITDLQGTGNAVLEVQHLRSMALLQLQGGDVDSALINLDTAERLCEKAGLDDLAVDLMSIRALAVLTVGDPNAALEVSRAAVAAITAGAERPYLIHHRHALAAEAAGENDEARAAMVTADRLLRSSLSGLEPAHLTAAIDRVPTHREIAAAAAAHAPRTVAVALPAIEAPTGTTLDSADLRQVVWTVEHPDDDRLADPVDRRRSRVLRLISEADTAGATPSTEHLAEALGVSATTIRRDLAALRASGHQVQSRGQRSNAS